jgi:hypothetical protein
MKPTIEIKEALDLVIEGKVYHWKEQHITGTQLKELAHLPDDVELYLAVPHPWKDELIQDEDIVDLARAEIESFFVKHSIPYTLNRVEYESDRQYIRGRQLRHQGNIPADQQIYLIHKGPWEDELVLDNDFIDLARPGIEHFISKPEQVDICIIVNGREKGWNERAISFEQAVRIAYPSYDPNSGKIYTVVYKKGPIKNPEGSMVPGQTVRVKNKMVFNVTETTRS